MQTHYLEESHRGYVCNLNRYPIDRSDVCLDEPSIGLHPRDNGRLLETLRELTSLGNTLLVVEHDEATLRRADWLVDIGPGAGKEGGRIVVNGKLNKLLTNKQSVTGLPFGAKRDFNSRR